MKKLTGAERVITTLRNAPKDRIPIGVYGGGQLPGITFEQTFNDAEKGAKWHEAWYEHFPVDLYTLGGITSSCIAEACGNEVEFPEVPPKKRILDDKSNLANLDIPDPKHDKRLPICLELYERVTSSIRDPLVSAQICWPWTVAGQLRGVEKLIYDTSDDANFVHTLMRYCTDCTMLIISAVNEVLAEGCALLFTDPSAGCSVISPKIYREFVKPYNKEIMDYLNGKERIVRLHVCGYIDPLIEEFVSLGVDIIDLDAISSLEKALSISKNRAAICGNVPTVLFAQGTKEDIEEAVKKCIDVGKPQMGYILSPGCSLPSNWIYENVNHFMEVGWKYGRYDPH